MFISFAVPGLISTILGISPDPTTTTSSSTLFSQPTITSTSTSTSCILVSTILPSTLPDVSTTLPYAGTHYYYSCGTLMAGVDLAVSGTSTITYPAVNSTSLPPGFTQIQASNGQAVTNSMTSGATTTGVPATTGSVTTSSTQSSTALSTTGAPTPSKGLSVAADTSPQSVLGLAVAIGLAVLMATF